MKVRLIFPGYTSSTYQFMKLSFALPFLLQFVNHSCIIQILMQVLFDFMVMMKAYSFTVQAAPRDFFKDVCNLAPSSTTFSSTCLLLSFTIYNGKCCSKPFHLSINCFPVSTGTWRNFQLNLWHYVHQVYLVYIPYRKRQSLCTATGTL